MRESAKLLEDMQVRMTGLQQMVRARGYRKRCDWSVLAYGGTERWANLTLVLVLAHYQPTIFKTRMKLYNPL